MCGIFFYYGNYYLTSEELFKAFMLIKYRGPDETKEVHNIGDKYGKINYGFHRLSINGLDKESGQPMNFADCSLMCNGEIYNFKELAVEYGIELKTHSDCEIIIHLYKKIGFINMLNKLEGVFSIVLYDFIKERTYIARDPVGIRPLFYGKVLNKDEYIFASEAKCLFTSFMDTTTIKQFPASSYLIFNTKDMVHSPFRFKLYCDLYINTQNSAIIPKLSYGQTINELRRLVNRAVDIRCNITDRPVGALLSGGIDSSIISMIAKTKIPSLRTFSIGLATGTDLLPAKLAAEAIGSNHTEVIFTVEEALASIEEVIRILETPDITTIRASTPMYLLSKYIKENTDIVVVLSGEGPDEVFAGYLYNHSAPSSMELQKDAEKRIKELPFYDVLRADRSTAAHSLEVRVPFLCKNIVNLSMHTDPEYRDPKSKYNKGIEKKMMRIGFSDIKEYLPKSNEEQCNKWKYIINRPKEAFSDGVGYEWKQSLKNLAESLISDEEYAKRNELYSIMTPENKEAFLYRKIYEKYYSRPYNCPLVKQFWLPTWGDHGGDPSATVLNIHSSKHGREHSD